MAKTDGRQHDPAPLVAAMRSASAGVMMAEMMAATSVVMGARLGMIGAAVRSPLDGDYRELGRMVPEKVAALSRSAVALFDGACRLQRDLADQCVEVGMLMLGGPPSAARLTTLASDASRRGARAMLWPLVTSDAAMAPVHATVTANARRLKKA